MNDLELLLYARRATKNGLARHIRTSLGFSQREIGEQCGVSAAAVSLWESSKRTPRGEPGATYGALLRRLQELP